MTRVMQYVALVATPLTLIAVWELAARADRMIAFSLGQPSQILRLLVTGATTGDLVYDVAITLSAALIGLVIGALAGFCIGALAGTNEAVDRALAPVLNVLSVIPLFAIGPVLIFSMGLGLGSKIFLSALASGFLAIALTYQHIRQTPASMMDLVSVTDPRAVLREVQLPYAALKLMTNLRALLGAAIAGALVGEFIGSNAGVGHAILVAEGLFNVNGIWVGILALSIGAVVLGIAASWAERYAIRRL